MAKSGLIQGTLKNHTDKFRSFLYWEVVNNQEDRIFKNYSRIRIFPIVDTTHSWQDWNGLVQNFLISINGTEKTLSNFNSNTDSGWTYNQVNSPTGRYAENIMEKASVSYYELDVSHEDDGTKTCNISCSFYLPSGSYGPGTVSISGSIELDTIPRTSYITSDSNLKIGDNLTVNILRYSDLFTHKISIYINNSQTAFKEATNVGIVKTFEMSSTDIENLYLLSVFNKELPLKIKLETYKDGNLIGESYKEGKLFVDESINRPTLSGFQFEPIDIYTQNLTGWTVALNDTDEDNGKSVSKVTKYKITFGEATALNQATISKYEVEINGYKYSSTTNIVNTYKPIMYTDFLKVSVYDSRGFKTTLSKKINPISYCEPIINSLSINRSNSTTLTIENETCITAVTNFTNIFKFRYRYKLEDSSTWSEWTELSGTNSNGTYTIEQTISNMSSLSTYNFEIEILDSITKQEFKITKNKINPEFEIKENSLLFHGEILFYDN